MMDLNGHSAANKRRRNAERKRAVLEAVDVDDDDVGSVESWTGGGLVGEHQAVSCQGDFNDLHCLTVMRSMVSLALFL